MLTKEAFNALLKSLEEPPKNVKFFLATTESQKVLPTIVSRCQRFDLLRIRPAEIIKKLRSIAKSLEVEAEDEALGLIARLSDGSLRDAESMFDQVICQGSSPITKDLVGASLGLVTKEHFFALDDAYREGDVGFAFSLSHDLFSQGKDVAFLIESLLEHYRHIVLLLLRKSDIETAFFDDVEKAGYKKAMGIYKIDPVLHLLDYLTDLLSQSNKTTYKRIHLEMILLKIIQSKNRVSIDQVVARLHELEGKPAPKSGAVQEPTSEPEPPLEIPPGAPAPEPEPPAESLPEPPAEPEAKHELSTTENSPPPKKEEVIQKFKVPNITPVDSGELALPKESPVQDVCDDVLAAVEKAAVVASPPQGQASPENVAPKAPETVSQTESTATATATVTEVAPSPEKVSIDEGIQKETIMRFAQVELGGILKKNL